MKEKICAICGQKNMVTDRVFVNEFITTYSDGAKEYFDLWHFPIERCENCKFASRDISECHNNNVRYLQANSYESILKQLNEARPNNIKEYIDASRYYQLIKDIKTQALCLLQAGDCVYNEIVYWKQYILTEDEKCEELYSFGNDLYDEAIVLLKTYLVENPDDIDMQLLLAGVLSDAKDKSISFALLQKIKTKKLNNTQKRIFDFLINEIY